MKKALFVVPLPPPWAGVEQISQLLLHSSLRDQFDVRVIKGNVRTSNAAKGAWDLAGMSRVGVIALKLFTTAAMWRPDVIYLTLSQNGSGLARDVLYILIAKALGVPVVAHLHGSKLTDYLASLPAWRRSLIVSVVGSVRVLVVCARSIGAGLAFLFPRTRIVTVYNAWSPSRMASRSDNGAAPKVIFMGHLSVAKGFYDVIAAIPAVLAKRPDTVFEFAGERLDKERNIQGAAKGNWDEVERLMAAHPKHIVWRGTVTGDEKEAFFANADVFVLPSHAEAFPVSVLEAMRYGLPLVVTPVGALAEVLKEGENALFVAPGDPTAIATALLRLLDDAALRSALSERNKAGAVAFSVERMQTEMAAIFDAAVTPS